MNAPFPPSRASEVTSVLHFQQAVSPRFDRFKDAITAVGSFHMPVKGGDPDFGVLTTLCGDTRNGQDVRTGTLH
jgi:hypothetical protein